MPRQQPIQPTVKTSAEMYRMGYRQATEEMYQGSPLRDLLYGYEHYSKHYDSQYNAYERGLSDALADRINAARREQ